ncbi:MAG: sugar-transfer associated ATP-grasp domain-containing protein [Promethearchaeota archaeon]
MRKKYFLPKDLFSLGLFNHQLGNEEISKYVSRKKLTLLQLSLNPENLESLLEDKSIFYLFCKAYGIPIPKLYAIFFKNNAGWSFNGLYIKNPNEWQEFFANSLPQEFVIKPARGVFGEYVMIVHKHNENFKVYYGKTYKGKELYFALKLNPKYNCFIIQERLRNHQEIIRLSNIPFLQTVRIITLIDKQGKCDILFSLFKIIRKQNIIDNFRRGRSGNLVARVDIHNGTLSPAIEMKYDGRGPRKIYRHPNTGIELKSFKLPMWKEASQLVKWTALKFSPIKTIGWDVALTPKGPIIVEGNMWYGPFNWSGYMGKVADLLARN